MTPDQYGEAKRLHDAGLRLCELHPDSKRPVGDGWNTTPVVGVREDAGGYGLLLAMNGLCSVDVDTEDLCREGLARCGFDLEEIRGLGVHTVSTRPGSGGRVTFRVPPGSGLKWVKFSSKVDGTILELRAESANLQDSLPGTVYHSADGSGPWVQEYAEDCLWTLDCAPEPPDWLLAWWQRLSTDVEFLREQQTLFIGPDAQTAISSGDGSLAFASPYRLDYNATNQVVDILDRHGYTKGKNERYAPKTATGAPCVRRIPGRDELWRSDHASDPLFGTFDAWTAHVVLDCGGDLWVAESRAERLRADDALDGFEEEEVVEMPVSRLKYDRVDEYRRDINTAVDEFILREKVCPKIQRDRSIDEFGREALAQSLLDAFKRLGSRYPIAQCRSLVAEPRVERHRVDDLPDWLQDWVYVSDKDQFYRMDSDEWLTLQGFNAKYNRNMPIGADGTIAKSASWTALEDYKVPTVTRQVYLPWADRIFDLNGVSCVNGYRPSSVPKAADSLSHEGRKVVGVIKKHIELLCGNREPIVRTMIDWMAHNVQKPGVKIRWAPLIKGIEGDGKSVVGTLMAAVMGQPNVRNVSPKVLGTDFTGWGEGSALVVLEEIKLTGHNRHDILNAVKPFITNDTVEIHRKGQDGYDAINTTNYLAFTNFADALPLTDTDRRYMIVFTPFSRSDDLAAAIGGVGNTKDVLAEYFRELNETIQQHRATLRRWLLDHKIDSSFRPNSAAPATEEKAVMVGMGVSDDEMTVREILEKGGVGITQEVFLSSYLSNEVLQACVEFSSFSRAWNLLLQRIGYTRLPKKIKWQGKSDVVWVKGHKLVEPDRVREILAKTLPKNEESSTSDDLF